MTWLQRYHVRLYLRNSIWILPAVGIVAALVSVSLVTRLDRSFGLEVNIHPDTARTIMGAVAGSTFTLVVLVSSTVLVSIQLASAQLTPRIIAMIYRDPFRKVALAPFDYTYTFSVTGPLRIHDLVPPIASYITA